jgi:phosphoglycolate phosphatase-like HAD superfamily hydrolase
MEQSSSADYSEFHSDNFGEITNIVWDGDNTLWPWVSYAAPAYEAMCQIIAQESGKSEDEVADAMRTIYAEAGTMEYANLIQDLGTKGFFDGMPNYDQHAMVDKVQQTFSNIRRKKLKLYAGIKEVVETVHENNIINIMITDAPEYQAQMRMKRSHLAKYMDGIFAMPSPELKNPHPKFQRRKERGDYNIEFASKAITTEKPHTNLEEILHMTRKQIRRHVVVIGDNPNKDMALVDAYECRGILAGYGKPDPADLETLKRFAIPRISNRNSVTTESIAATTKLKGLIVPVNRPKDILKVLGLPKAA